MAVLTDPCGVVERTLNGQVVEVDGYARKLRDRSSPFKRMRPDVRGRSVATAAHVERIQPRWVSKRIKRIRETPSFERSSVASCRCGTAVGNSTCVDVGPHGDAGLLPGWRQNSGRRRPLGFRRMPDVNLCIVLHKSAFENGNSPSSAVMVVMLHIVASGPPQRTYCSFS
jgi:hypothetical protein